MFSIITAQKSYILRISARIRYFFGVMPRGKIRLVGIPCYFLLNIAKRYESRHGGLGLKPPQLQVFHQTAYSPSVLSVLAVLCAMVFIIAPDVVFADTPVVGDEGFGQVALL